jgi:hypothetical protein
MLDPIAIFTGVGIEAVAAKTSVTMRAMALNIAKASTNRVLSWKYYLIHRFSD